MLLELSIFDEASTLVKNFDPNVICYRRFAGNTRQFHGHKNENYCMIKLIVQCVWGYKVGGEGI